MAENALHPGRALAEELKEKEAARVTADTIPVARMTCLNPTIPASHAGDGAEGRGPAKVRAQFCRQRLSGSSNFGHHCVGQSRDDPYTNDARSGSTLEHGRTARVVPTPAVEASDPQRRTGGRGSKESGGEIDNFTLEYCVRWHLASSEHGTRDHGAELRIRRNQVAPLPL